MLKIYLRIDSSQKDIILFLGSEERDILWILEEKPETEDKKHEIEAFIVSINNIDKYLLP